jgi:hypothetical protein
MDKEHRKVVGAGGIAGEFPGRFQKRHYGLLSGQGRAQGVSEGVLHAGSAKRLSLGILGLREAVRIKENGSAKWQLNGLFLKNGVLENAKRKVGLGRKEGDVMGNKERFVVTSVTVAELSRIKIQAAYKEGHEHICIVVPARLGIKDGKNPGGTFLLL